MVPLRDFKCHQVEQLLLEAQMGQIVDCEVVWKFGRNEAIGTSECVIWEDGCTYTYPSSTSKLKDVQIFYKVRPFGKVFTTKETFGLYQNSLEASRPFLPIPEKSDLQVSAISSSSGTDISVQSGLLLFKNSTRSN